MSKIVAGINMTLDGVCDHTAVSPDEDVHQHYTDLLHDADTILYGRITYELMEYWRPFVINPSGEESMDDFAKAIGKIHKIVFSHKLKNVDWDSAELSTKTLEDTINVLKQKAGKDVLVGSRSLIIQLANLDLIDEFQICIHPVIAGKGMLLFDQIDKRINLKLVKTKIFDSGAIIHYYARATL